MPPLFLAATAAFVAAVIFTPPLRRWARAAPSRREAAGREPASLPPVPRMGGLAVWAATAAGLGVVYALGLPLGRQLADMSHFRALLGPLGLVVLVGWLDDRWGLAPALKLAGQAAAALWVAVGGVRIGSVLYHPVPLFWSVTLTVLWLVGCSNAFNLIDGLDGLAGGLALFANTTLLAHAVLNGEAALALFAAGLFGGLAGFLFFNLPPASVYLGDSGSLSIGFFLGALALLWFDKATTAVGLLAPLFALFVPVTDTAMAVLRRGLAGKPLFMPDRRHVHHRLLALGLRPRSAILALYLVAGAGAVLALLLADQRNGQRAGLVILLFVALAAIGIHRLGYVEFIQSGRRLRRDVVDHGRMIQAYVALGRWATASRTATGLEQLGAELAVLGGDLEWQAVELRLGPEEAPHWRRRWNCGGAAEAVNGWSLEVPLGETGDAVRIWPAASFSSPALLQDIAAALHADLPPALRRLAGGAGAAAAVSGGTA